MIDGMPSNLENSLTKEKCTNGELNFQWGK